MSIPVVKTHYSIHQAFAKPSEVAQIASERDMPALAIADTHTLSGVPEFFSACQKKGIKAIAGCEVFTNKGKFLVLAKNKNGWYDLIKIIGSTSPLSLDVDFAYFEEIFEKGNLFIEKGTGADIFYASKADREMQQVILAIQHTKTISEISEMDEYKCFFDSYNGCLETYEHDIHHLNLNLDEFDEYNLAENPMIPSFKEANGDPDSYITNLCREGWREKNLNQLPENLKKVYIDRIKEELDTFKEAGISGYMLVIRDIVLYGKSQGQNVGLRGSAGGCLVSYLIGISDIDPVCPDPTLSYDPNKSLLFERFFNRGRMADGHISLADVDVDIPISFRDELIKYVEDRYGEDHVGHIITFQRLDGRGAIKEIFRVLDVPNYFDIANAISKHMVDTAKVQDDLQDRMEDNPDYTIINYCIDEIPTIAEYAREYPREFEMAIHLAKTINGQGKHAAGIVITDQPLHIAVPTAIDPKTQRRLVSLEMAYAEYCGAVKYDFLGVAALEKIDKICEMVEQSLDMPTDGNAVHFKDYE